MPRKSKKKSDALISNADLDKLIARISGLTQSQKDSVYEALIYVRGTYERARVAWLHAFPPEWDRHPWANWACLVGSWSAHDGVTFMWYYFEQEPKWGKKSYNWVDGKWGFEQPVTRAPLSVFFNTKDTLQRRPDTEEK